MHRFRHFYASLRWPPHLHFKCGFGYRRICILRSLKNRQGTFQLGASNYGRQISLICIVDFDNQNATAWLAGRCLRRYVRSHNRFCLRLHRNQDAGGWAWVYLFFLASKQLRLNISSAKCRQSDIQQVRGQALWRYSGNASDQVRQASRTAAHPIRSSTSGLAHHPLRQEGLPCRLAPHSFRSFRRLAPHPIWPIGRIPADPLRSRPECLSTHSIR